MFLTPNWKSTDFLFRATYVLLIPNRLGSSYGYFRSGNIAPDRDTSTDIPISALIPDYDNGTLSEIQNHKARL